MKSFFLPRIYKIKLLFWSTLLLSSHYRCLDNRPDLASTLFISHEGWLVKSQKQSPHRVFELYQGVVKNLGYYLIPIRFHCSSKFQKKSEEFKQLTPRHAVGASNIPKYYILQSVSFSWIFQYTRCTFFKRHRPRNLQMANAGADFTWKFSLLLQTAWKYKLKK